MIFDDVEHDHCLCNVGLVHVCRSQSGSPPVSQIEHNPMSLLSLCSVLWRQTCPADLLASLWAKPQHCVAVSHHKNDVAQQIVRCHIASEISTIKKKQNWIVEDVFYLLNYLLSTYLFYINITFMHFL